MLRDGQSSIECIAMNNVTRVGVARTYDDVKEPHTQLDSQVAKMSRHIRIYLNDF